MQKFKFEISKGPNNAISFLKNFTKFSFANGIEKVEEIYKFGYYDSAPVPDYDNLSKYADWCGYYTSMGGRKLLPEEITIYSPYLAVPLS